MVIVGYTLQPQLVYEFNTHCFETLRAWSVNLHWILPFSLNNFNQRRSHSDFISSLCFIYCQSTYLVLTTSVTEFTSCFERGRVLRWSYRLAMLVLQFYHDFGPSTTKFFQPCIVSNYIPFYSNLLHERRLLFYGQCLQLFIILTYCYLNSFSAVVFFLSGDSLTASMNRYQYSITTFRMFKIQDANFNI